MMNRIKQNISLICSAFFLSFTVCLYAPMTIYASNRSEFWFNLRSFWGVPVSVFFVSFFLTTLIGLLLRGRLYNIYLSLLFGLALCFYLQGNFFYIRLGDMNGGRIDWDLYRFRMWINVCVWILIIALVAAAFIWKTKLMQKVTLYISALFSIMQLGSLIVMMVPLFQQGDFKTSTMPALTTEGLYEVGSEDNIIVFILDAYDETFFKYVQEEAPEITSEFDGFVFYDNFTSVFPRTAYSLTGIMGGQIFRNEMPRYTWVEENAKQRLYFDDLLDQGYEISLYTKELYTISQRVKNMASNYVEAPMHFYNIRTCFSTLYRLAAIQYFPDICKLYTWMDGNQIASTGKIETEYPIYDESNAKFKYGLDQNGLLIKEGKKQYKFIHLWGHHEPYYIDEWGNEAEQTFEPYEPAKGCMRIMLDYCDKLKEAGVYDRSTIIITADHGWGFDSGVIGNPLFMIKRQNARGHLETCSYETGLENFPATIADLCGSEHKNDYGLSILDITEDTRFDRYYYQYIYEDYRSCPSKDSNYYLVEYLTSCETNDVSQFKLTGVEYLPSGEKIPHRQYCETCLSGQDELGVAYDNWPAIMHIHVSDFPY